MEFTKTTEQDSRYNDIDKMSVGEILHAINAEDRTVADAVNKELKAIEELTKATTKALQNGGRIFYIGAGTSGRLGILDASECPPTFGVEKGLVIGLIAGGDSAIRDAVEFAEDSMNAAWQDLQTYNVSTDDIVIGIAASGTTPYVLGALQACKEHGIATGSITCNLGNPIAQVADYAVTVVVGPEFITGSSRMKAGTAQKMVLNMLSTATMIKMGRVKGNKMVDMQLSNNKLIDRAVRILQQELDISTKEAQLWIDRYPNVRDAIKAYNDASNR